MKILFLTNHPFDKVVCNGGGVCAKRNFQILKRIVGQYNIYNCIITYEPHESGDNYTKYIDIKPNRLIMYYNYIFGRARFNKKNEKKILDYINSIKPNLIFFDGTTFGSLSNKIDRSIKVIVFFHNLEKKYAWMCFLHKNPLCILKFFSDWYNEKIISEKADKVICLNERDRELIVKSYHRNPNMIWPITLKDNFKDSERNVFYNSILFVGSYFTPNIEGIKWFVENIMPEIECKLIIVGKDMENLTCLLKEANVELIGTVDDLEPFYKKADAIIMPIFMGGGMKIKMAEAMMYGKTIFATKEALEGYEVDDIEGIYECNTAQEFIENINDYYTKKGSKKFNALVRNKFLKEYEDESKYKEIRLLISDILKGEE